MEVRRIRPGEVAAYREVRLRALRLAPHAFGSTFAEASTRDDADWREFTERLATSDHTAGFVLDRGDGAFGGLASVRLLDDAPGDAEINQMWVDEDLRGGPWGAGLLGACERLAAAVGVVRLTLWVAEDNERAVRLYARCGYTPTGETDEEAAPHLGVEVQLAKTLR